MQPVSYIEKDGLVTFLYNQKEYCEWYQRGIEYGDVGEILVSIDDKFYTYHCFGTIEHPRTEMYIMKLMHNEAFDGPQQTPLQIITPIPFEETFWGKTLKDMKLVFLDFSNDNNGRKLHDLLPGTGLPTLPIQR